MSRPDDPQIARRAPIITDPMGDTVTVPKPPAGLGKPGTALWRAVLGDLDSAGMDLDPREAELLLHSCREVDIIDRLQQAVDTDGVVITTTTGATRTHPAVTELRQHRVALDKLLGSLALPDSDGIPRTAVSARKARAAEVRWSRFQGRRGVAGGTV